MKIFILCILILTIFILNSNCKKINVSINTIPKDLLGIPLSEKTRKQLFKLWLKSGKDINKIGDLILSSSEFSKINKYLLSSSPLSSSSSSTLSSPSTLSSSSSSYYVRSLTTCSKMGFENDNSTNVDCGFGTYNLKGKCISFAQLTENQQFKSCSSNSDCFSTQTGLSCISNKCRWPQKWESESCESDDECGGICSNKVCKFLKLGESCSSTNRCEKDQYCGINGKCKKYPSRGETCSSYCENNSLGCHKFVCVTKQPNGAKCESSAECISNYCEDNKCVDLKYTGQECKMIGISTSNCKYDYNTYNQLASGPNLFLKNELPDYYQLCIKGKCQRTFSVGSGGECEFDKQCIEGYVCINKKCQKKYSCDKDSDCGTFKCRCKNNNNQQGTCLGNIDACYKHFFNLVACSSYYCTGLGVVQDPNSCIRKKCGHHHRYYLGCINSQYNEGFGKSIGRIYGYNNANNNQISIILLLISFISIYLSLILLN